jgi:protein-disulfide isomerase
MRAMRWPAALLAALVGVGCERTGEPPAAPASMPVAAAPDVPAVVARVGGEAVTGAELDRALGLRLYDLDVARYELRATRLRELLLARVFGASAAAEQVPVPEYVRRQAAAAATSEAAFVAAAFVRAGVDVLLAPPEPPVLEVSIDDDAVRGPADAPVTIVVFCDYQSPYCAGMQPVLQRLLAAYPTQVRLVARDFPLPLHRDAGSAAEAAECAGEQDAYWAYHDVLSQERSDLGRAALARYAQRLGLDVARFVACLDERRMRVEVEADAAAARALGLSAVPTTFVDGRYLRGPQPYEVLRAAVDAALARRGLAAPAATPPSTTLPPQPRQRPSAPSAPDVQATPAPASTITLPAALVAGALARRGQLAADLERPAYDLGPGYEGRTLVRVGRVRPGGLYEAMGLRPGDVVMRVNDVLVLDGGDALFDALRDDTTVLVQVLRHGLPQTYEYRVE